MEVGRLEYPHPERSMQTLFSPDQGSRWSCLPSPDTVPPPPSVSLGPRECGAHCSSSSGCFNGPKGHAGTHRELRQDLRRSTGSWNEHMLLHMLSGHFTSRFTYFFSPNGLKYSYYFIYHLYADSFQISVFSPAFSPEPQTQIPKFLPCEQKLNPVTMMSQESFYTGNVNMHNFGG